MGISVAGSVYTSEVRRRLRGINIAPSADIQGLIHIEVRVVRSAQAVSDFFRLSLLAFGNLFFTYTRGAWPAYGRSFQVYAIGHDNH